MRTDMKRIVLENLGYFFAITVCIFVSNLIINLKAGNGMSPFSCIPTLVLLAAVSFAGVLLKHFIKLNIPTIIYTCILATILSLPCFPWYNAIITMLGNLQFNAVMTPILTFTGLSVGKDVGAFLRAGPKLIIVSICVFIGTYLGSAGIAQIGLLLTGQIG